MNRVLRGVSWTALAAVLGQLVQFGTSLALARVLAPEDFGLLALVYVVTGVTVLFFEVGLYQALIYDPRFDRELQDTAFWLNALGGVTFVGVLCALALPAAHFFDEPRLAYLVPLGGLPFLLDLAVVPAASLARDMRFGALAAAEVTSTVVNNGVTVVLAVIVREPWVLVVGPAAGAVANTALVLRLRPWRPAGFVTRASAARLWKFSGGALTSSLLGYLGGNSDNFLIGKVLGAAPLGYYSRGYNLITGPLGRITSMVTSVAFPALAAMQDDRERLAKNYRRVVRAMLVVMLPVLAGVTVTAPGLVPLLWGPRWEPTVAVVQALCVTGLAMAFNRSTGLICQATGRTWVMAALSGLGTTLNIIGVVVGLRWGVVGVALGVAAASALASPVTVWVGARLSGAACRRLVAENAPTVALVGAMSAVVWWVPSVAGIERGAAGAVALQVLVGAVTYAAGIAVIHRRTLSAVSGQRRSRATSAGLADGADDASSDESAALQSAAPVPEQSNNAESARHGALSA